MIIRSCADHDWLRRSDTRQTSRKKSYETNKSPPRVALKEARKSHPRRYKAEFEGCGPPRRLCPNTTLGALAGINKQCNHELRLPVVRV